MEEIARETSHQSAKPSKFSAFIYFQFTTGN
jgi:hypothetical protein